MVTGSEGTCALCMKGGTLNCLGLCSKCRDKEYSRHEVEQLAAYEGDMAKLECNPKLPNVPLKLPIPSFKMSAVAARESWLREQGDYEGHELGAERAGWDAGVQWLLECVTGAKGDQAVDNVRREATIAPEELSHILAALTFFRQARLGDAENRPPPIQRIATNGGTLPSLSDERLRILVDCLDGVQRITVGLPPETQLGTKCPVCNEPQHASKVGPVCPNGHRGALILGEAARAESPHGRCWNCGRIFGSTNEATEHAGICPEARRD